MTPRAISVVRRLVMAENIEKVRFKCPHCGCTLSVPADRTAKRGKCPRCQERLTIPGASLPSGAAPVEDRRAAAPDSAAAELSLIPPVLDAALLDVSGPPASESTPDESRGPDEQLRGMEDRYLLEDKEGPPQRKLPWIIDIFLYPFNLPGLTTLGITVGIPLLLRMLVYFFMACSALFPPVIVFWVLAIVVNWAGSFLLLLYMNWYACECIRDSAQGNIRAADTVAITPGLGDLFSQTFRGLLCVLACVAPALIYHAQTHQVDTIFLALLGIGGFVLPMALLAVTMFDSLAGLNPVLLASSILSTFLPYCLLVPFCYTLIVLFPLAVYFIRMIGLSGYLVLFATYCLWLVLAHLLGRFFWKYEDRLNWAA